MPSPAPAPSRRSDSPRYLALADAIADQITAGLYPPGTKIPSVRRLREQHGVSVTTVVEACRVLEARGLVRARPRSGYFVERTGRHDGLLPGAPRPAMRSRRVDAALSMQLNLGIGNPQRPTLGAAVQGPELMAIATVNRLLGHALRHEPTVCHSYDAPPGSPVLRRAIAQHGIDAGYRADPDEVVITSGAKEAVYLSIRAVTRPGDTVAIESPAYYALLEVLASLQLKVVEIPVHPRHGMDLDVLARALERHDLAAVAMVSNYSNPSGACMTDEAKQRLVDLVDRHGVALVEDDVYGELVFDGPRPKAIKAFDTTGSVLYCGSFSKTVSPGLRLGWALPGRFQNRLEHLKLVVNQATATAPQVAMAAFLESGGFDRHLARTRRRYADQMHQAADAIGRHFPTDTRHTEPTGGHVLWIQVPGLDSMALYQRAVAQGIHVAPGPMFSASGGFVDHLRINTGFPWTDQLEAQVATLGQLVTDCRS